MFDWELLIDTTRADISACLDAWSYVLQKFLNQRIDYAYAKGSSLKPWESLIDYVPIISDVDIHIMLCDSGGLFPDSQDAFADAMNLSQEYEDQFNKIRPEHLHIPRSQLVLIDALSEIINYVPPRAQDVRMIIGEFTELTFPTKDTIRRIDYENLLSLSEFVNRIPNRIADRTGFDFWSIIREMTWRVSPSPIRLLTQNAEDPLDVWSWNRTRIINELCAQGYDTIGDHYRNYYTAGWNLFLSGFTSSSYFRQTLAHGYYILQKCFKAAESMT
ncbi:MAG: hypothetical protein ACFFCT_11285 [Candidatus Odinarchaeota archaeon]